jgi:stress-induced morphogen
MADAQLKSKIHDTLKQGYFSGADDVVDVSDSDASDEFVHVVIVSRKFEGRRLKEKSDLIWSELVQRLSPEEWGHVTLSIGVSPADVNGATIEDIKRL